MAVDCVAKLKITCESCLHHLLCRYLDESLQKALHRYLETRGVKHSLHDWLYEYMMEKDEKEYVVWLKNMKEFIGN